MTSVPSSGRQRNSCVKSPSCSSIRGTLSAAGDRNHTRWRSVAMKSCSMGANGSGSSASRAARTLVGQRVHEQGGLLAVAQAEVVRGAARGDPVRVRRHGRADHAAEILLAERGDVGGGERQLGRRARPP
jgi:hypothetical protein